MQDIATLMAEALAPVLVKEPARPLHFLNIAGGPTIDSLNTLILLSKNQPGILAAHQISIDVLDLDAAGPAFGARALESLSLREGPLRGIRVALRHVPYDWTKVADLKPVLTHAQTRRALVICRLSRERPALDAHPSNGRAREQCATRS